MSKINISNVISVTTGVAGFVVGVIPLLNDPKTQDSITTLGDKLKFAILNYGSLHSLFVWSIFLTIYGTLYLYELYHLSDKVIVNSKTNHRFDLWKLGVVAGFLHVSMTITGRTTHFYEIIPFISKNAVDITAVCLSIFCTFYGILWLMWGRVSINGYWSPNIHEYEKMKIIDLGAYAKARHPIYGGQILITSSIFFACNNILLIALPAFAIIQSYKRLKEEEKALLEYSPNIYGTYLNNVKRTFFWIPFL